MGILQTVCHCRAFVSKLSHRERFPLSFLAILYFLRNWLDKIILWAHRNIRIVQTESNNPYDIYCIIYGNWWPSWYTVVCLVSFDGHNHDHRRRICTASIAMGYLFIALLVRNVPIKLYRTAFGIEKKTHSFHFHGIFHLIAFRANQAIQPIVWNLIHLQTTASYCRCHWYVLPIFVFLWS